MADLRKLLSSSKRMVDRLLGRDTHATQPRAAFTHSADYWEQRYADGKNSGVGSYGKFAEFKAEILNGFVTTHGISSVIEFGCGDGNQLSIAIYPQYTGVDVSATAIDSCRRRFAADPTRTFLLANDYRDERAELGLSLDVIYHLVEDPVFHSYMQRLFDSASRFVVIYSSNTDVQESNQPPHVRHRCFSGWVEVHRPQWRLYQYVANRYPYTGDHHTGSFADFFIFEKA